MEFELKFEVSGDALQRLRKKPLLRQIGTGQPVTRRLRSIYFDTPDCRLRQAGFSARIRRDQGKWLQTVKEIHLDPETSPGRIEAETEIGEPVPDLSLVSPSRLRKRVQSALDGEMLMPMFETDVLRTTRILRGEDGSEIELALDKGNIKGSDCSGPITETEFELKQGRPESLFPVAKSVLAGEAYRLLHTSKAENGYRLINCCNTGGISSVIQDKISFQADDTVSEAFRAIANSCGSQVLRNIDVVLLAEDPEGVHQLRIGLRRLRCALRAHKKLLAVERVRSLVKSAGGLARGVGDLRDIDVLIDEFAKPYALRYGTEGSAGELVDALCAHRDRTRDSVRSELSSPECSEFQLDLLSLLNGISLSSSDDRKARKLAGSPVAEFAPHVLDKSWARVLKYGRRIDRLSVAERHKMRKALKNHRYTVEFYASLVPSKSLRRYRKRLKRLQDVFGFLNDVAMSRKLRGICSAGAKSDPDVMWTIGHIQGLNEARAETAWETAKDSWQELSKMERIWVAN